MGTAAFAQDMPDPSVMHGRPLPAPELADGTITVRVVREALGNNIEGQLVRLTVGETMRTASTDSEGRAEFTGLPSGEARAEATVDGEALVSQPFQVPSAGGIRVALVAGLAQAAERRKKEEAEAAAAPATKGVVVLGGDSRIVMEFNNDSLFASYILEIVNEARTRVDIGGPLVIDLPEGIGGAQLMEGSTPSATIDGNRITIPGPFASGVTPLQVQFAVQFRGPERTIVQTFPIPLQRVIVGVEKVRALAADAPELSMTSPQLPSVNDLPTENGTYLFGQGGALAAGSPLTVTLSGLPVHSATPRYVAFALVAVLVVASTWLSVTARSSRGRDRQALAAKRDSLLGDLAQLEARYRDGAIAGARYLPRRQRILAQLEQIYAELDDAGGVGPQGGGEGIAA
jgi:hypothetical protein